ncbi:MAG TPA: DoxX family protein [Candidatus Paceibacterota bacterium]|nr:DoxX family protein [Candidatus Paceibacterota bacterium]
MQKYYTLFWIATASLVFFEGVLTVINWQSPEALTDIMSLGYPIYFAFMLMAFKVLGAIALILPQTPRRIREWAYVGFAFDFISAFISHLVVEGLEVEILYSVGAFALLVVSYLSYEKLHPLFAAREQN